MKKEAAVLLGVLLVSFSFGCNEPEPGDGGNGDEVDECDKIYVDSLYCNWSPGSQIVFTYCRIGNRADYDIGVSFEAWVKWWGGERRLFDSYEVPANSIYRGRQIQFGFLLEGVIIDELDELIYGFDWGGTYRKSVNRTISPRLG